jgi:oligopeptide/dipeptide ABC transporter ATP-binding protein
MRGKPLERIPSTPTSLAQLPPGCAFAPRCSYMEPACRADKIPVVVTMDGAMARCVRAAAQEHA